MLLLEYFEEHPPLLARPGALTLRPKPQLFVMLWSTLRSTRRCWRAQVR